jgi:hypothetical protein
LDKDSISWILSHIDCFVSQSRGNESVERVSLYPYSVDGRNNAVWDKVGQAIGNLQALERLHISIRDDYHDGSDYSDEDDDEDENSLIPDWEIVARILRHVRQSVKIIINNVDLVRTIEELQAFARAIRGHPSVTSFYDSGRFPFESSDSFYTVLATLRALESVTLGAPEVRQADESTLTNPESLTELLRVPTLRSVCFSEFNFTSALWQATAKAFMEGMVITNLMFVACTFPAGECAAILATGLTRNTSVTSIVVRQCNARAPIDALPVALTSNSTLRHLELDQCDHLPPVFSALGQNTGLNSLEVACFDSMDESLCTAMKYGLGVNETLESLELNYVPLLDESAALWCRAFSFLCTNKTLKSLIVHLKTGSTESCVAVFRIAIAAMLQENASLANLSIRKSWNGIETTKAEEYNAFVTAKQRSRCSLYITRLKVFG